MSAELTRRFEEEPYLVRNVAVRKWEQAERGLVTPDINYHLGRAKDWTNPNRSAEWEKYLDAYMAQLQARAVPICYGAPGAWVGAFDPQTAAEALLGHPAGMPDAEILAALAAAKFDYEGAESDSEARNDEITDFDPLNPKTWRTVGQVLAMVCPLDRATEEWADMMARFYGCALIWHQIEQLLADVSV